jgi:hypothetical protein
LALAPEKQVDGGAKILDLWTKYAASGRLLNCVNADEVPEFNPYGSQRNPNEVRRARSSHLILASYDSNKLMAGEEAPTNCIIIVRNTRDTDLEFLLACQLISVGGIDGAPEHCISIAASDKHRNRWLLAVVGSLDLYMDDLGTPDFRFNLFAYDRAKFMSVTSGPSLTFGAVLSAVQEALRMPPVNMETRITTIVRGTAAQRTSRILKDFNEKGTVTVEVVEHREPNVAVGHFEIEVATSIVVNEQKDPISLHWHLLTQAQTKMWADAVRKNLASQVATLCQHPRQLDDFSISCEQQ